jgi:hypothetical protein
MFRGLEESIDIYLEPFKEERLETLMRSLLSIREMELEALLQHPYLFIN